MEKNFFPSKININKFLPEPYSKTRKIEGKYFSETSHLIWNALFTVLYQIFSYIKIKIKILRIYIHIYVRIIVAYILAYV